MVELKSLWVGLVVSACSTETYTQAGDGGNEVARAGGSAVAVAGAETGGAATGGAKVVASTGGRAAAVSSAPAVTGGAVATGGTRAVMVTGGAVATGGTHVTALVNAAGAAGVAGASSCRNPIKAECFTYGAPNRDEQIVFDCWIANSCGPRDACSSISETVESNGVCSPYVLGTMRNVARFNWTGAAIAYICACEN